MRKIIPNYDDVLAKLFEHSTEQIIADIRGKKLYHTSSPFTRDDIRKSGKLIPLQKTWGKNADSMYNRHLDKAIFCKIGEPYDSTYDDIYEIDTNLCPNTFYYDMAIDDDLCVYTLNEIDLKYCKLIYKGTVE